MRVEGWHKKSTPQAECFPVSHRLNGSSAQFLIQTAQVTRSIGGELHPIHNAVNEHHADAALLTDAHILLQIGLHVTGGGIRGQVGILDFDAELLVLQAHPHIQKLRLIFAVAMNNEVGYHFVHGQHNLVNHQLGKMVTQQKLAHEVTHHLEVAACAANSDCVFHPLGFRAALLYGHRFSLRRNNRHQRIEA